MTESLAQATILNARWPQGPVCPRCKGLTAVYVLGRNELQPRDKQQDVAVPRFKCAGCRKEFSLLGGTPLSGTKLPLATWLQTIDGLCAAPSGLSSAELSDKAGITRKSALLVLRRIHHARSQPNLFLPWRKALRALASSSDSAVAPRHRRDARHLLEEIHRASRLQPGPLVLGIPSSRMEFRVTLWPLLPDAALRSMLRT